MGKLLPTVNARLLNVDDDYAVENLSPRFPGFLNSKVIEIFVQIYIYIYSREKDETRISLIILVDKG